MGDAQPGGDAPRQGGPSSRSDLPSPSEAAEQRNSAGERPWTRRRSPITCKAAGCFVDLSQCGAYYMKKRICPAHMRADALCRTGRGGELWRFCQQCGKLQQLSMFQGSKRSCRVSLEKRRLQAASRASGGRGERPARPQRCTQSQADDPACCPSAHVAVTSRSAPLPPALGWPQGAPTDAASPPGATSSPPASLGARLNGEAPSSSPSGSPSGNGEEAPAVEVLVEALMQDVELNHALLEDGGVGAAELTDAELAFMVEAELVAAGLLVTSAAAPAVAHVHAHAHAHPRPFAWPPARLPVVLAPAPPAARLPSTTAGAAWCANVVAPLMAAPLPPRLQGGAAAAYPAAAGAVAPLSSSFQLPAAAPAFALPPAVAAGGRASIASARLDRLSSQVAEVQQLLWQLQGVLAERAPVHAAAAAHHGHVELPQFHQLHSMLSCVSSTTHG